MVLKLPLIRSTPSFAVDQVVDNCLVRASNADVLGSASWAACQVPWGFLLPKSTQEAAQSFESHWIGANRKHAAEMVIYKKIILLPACRSWARSLFPTSISCCFSLASWLI